MRLPDGDLGVLGERLSYLGVTMISFAPESTEQKRISASDIRRLFRDILHEPGGLVLTAPEVSLVPLPVVKPEEVSKSLECYWKPTAEYVFFLMTFAKRISGLEAEAISDVLAIMPRRFAKSKVTETHIEGALQYPGEIINVISSYLNSLEEKGAEAIELLGRKNQPLYNSLMGNPEPAMARFPRMG
jgi:hypothetical protein